MHEPMLLRFNIKDHYYRFLDYAFRTFSKEKRLEFSYREAEVALDRVRVVRGDVINAFILLYFILVSDLYGIAGKTHLPIVYMRIEIPVRIEQ